MSSSTSAGSPDAVQKLNNNVEEKRQHDDKDNETVEKKETENRNQAPKAEEVYDIPVGE